MIIKSMLSTYLFTGLIVIQDTCSTCKCRGLIGYSIYSHMETKNNYQCTVSIGIIIIPQGYTVKPLK